jgi:hypothetical protein
MSQPQRMCAAVRGKSSSFLDGRLSADARRIVQQHLQVCAECKHVLQSLARISRATHNLPQHRAPSDLASRVRARMASHREVTIAQLRRHRADSYWLLAVAAVVLISTAWTAGFWMGHQTRSAEVAQVPAAAHPPASPAVLPIENRLEPRDPSRNSFAATTRDVLQDLAIVANLPQHARQPLIAAQLAYFELPQRAQPILVRSAPESLEHKLARFVVELSTAIDGNDTMDWSLWHHRARQQGLLAPARVTKLPDSTSAVPQLAAMDRVRSVVQQQATRLSAEEQQGLTEFLLLKREHLSGELGASLDLIDRWQAQPEQASSTFAFASASTSTRTLAEAGRTNDAQRMLQMLRSSMRLPSEAVPTASGAWQDCDGNAANPAAQMLERLMREMGLEMGRRER